MILHLGSAGIVRFTPSLIPSTVTLMLLSLLLGLGLWQLDRASQKQTLLNAFQERVELPPVALSARAQVAPVSCENQTECPTDAA